MSSPRRVGIFGSPTDDQVVAVADGVRSLGVEPLVVQLVPDELGGWRWSPRSLHRGDGTDMATLDAVYVRSVPVAAPRHGAPVVPPAERARFERQSESGQSWHGVARSAQRHLADLGVDMINPAECFWFHRSKPAADLRVAAAGLRTPASLVTSDPDAARAFLDEFAGEVIFKPVAGGGACRVLTAELLDETGDRLRAAPVLLQQRARGADLRIYTIDDEVVGSCVIHTDNVDYRGHETGLEAIEISDEVAAIAVAAAKALGMTFAGIDIKDPGTGEYTVLDVNPSPMFAALSASSGLQVPQALARRLVEGRTS